MQCHLNFSKLEKIYTQKIIRNAVSLKIISVTLGLTLSYTAIIGIASFTAVAENGQCKNNCI